MTRRLPYDWTRCLGIGCLVREDCARFRDQPENIDLSWVENMNQAWHWDPEYQSDCKDFVPYDDKEAM